MKTTNWMILVVLSLIGVAANAQEQDDFGQQSVYRTIVWRERPVAISMVPGKEKILSFSEDVKWGIPKSLVGIVSGEAVAGQVFLNSKSKFTKQRFRFYGIDSNRYYLLDITASSRGDETPLQILYQENVPAQVRNQGGENTQASAPSNLVELTRFAFQSIYSPERLIEPLRDVSKIRVKDKSIKNHILTGASVAVTPIAQWRTDDGRYVVGLRIQNHEARDVELNPTQMRYGERWRTMALYSSFLSPVNALGDSTTAVVIADGAWEEISQWLH